MLHTVATRIRAIAPEFAYVETHALCTPVTIFVVMGFDGNTVVDINEDAEELFLATLKAEAAYSYRGKRIEYVIDGVTVLVDYASRY